MNTPKPIIWKVYAASTVYGIAYIKADTKEEADEKADKLTAVNFDWSGSDNLTVTEVKPA